MKALQGLRTSVAELKQFDPSSGKLVEKINSVAIHGLEKSLDKVDEQILNYISEDQELKKKYDLMLTVKA